MRIKTELVCPFCGKTHTVSPLIQEIEAYNNGALAQDAFVSLTPTEREQIISHICPDCQKEIFG